MYAFNFLPITYCVKFHLIQTKKEKKKTFFQKFLKEILKYKGKKK